MIIIGVDYHPSVEQIAFVDKEKRKGWDYQQSFAVRFARGAARSKPWCEVKHRCLVAGAYAQLLRRRADQAEPGEARIPIQPKFRFLLLEAHFFFSCASQFSTTVIGFVSWFLACVRIKNFWPSLLTSYAVWSLNETGCLGVA